MIAPFGVSGLSVAGSATICTRSRAGNQLTRSGADSRSHVRGAELTLTVPARWEPLATTPTETVCARLRKPKRARPACVAEHDEPHRLIERDRDRLAGRHLEPASAQLGGRGDDVERLVGGVADEPAGPGRPLHGDVDRQPLAGRHRHARPELPVANIDRDRLAATRVDGHLFDGSRIAGLLDRGERVGSGAEGDVRPGEQGRGGGDAARGEGSRRAPTARACVATSVAVCC